MRSLIVCLLLMLAGCSYSHIDQPYSVNMALFDVIMQRAKSRGSMCVDKACEICVIGPRLPIPEGLQ